MTAYDPTFFDRRIFFYYKNIIVCKKTGFNFFQELTELWPFKITGENSQNFETISLAEKNIDNLKFFWMVADGPLKQYKE